MIFAALLICAILFVEAFLFLEMGKQARGILAHARDALHTLRDGHRSDEEKELCARRASRLILTATAVLVSKLLGVAVVLGIVLAGAAVISRDGEAELTAALVSPEVIVVLSLVAVCYLWARNAFVRQI